jgi:hypothetical protein
MPFVLDASIPACWALQDEEDPRAETAFARIKTDEAAVASLWWFEIRNILIVNERRKRITESNTSVFLRDLAGLRVRVDREPEESVVLRLARTHRLSIYGTSVSGTGGPGSATTGDLGRSTYSGGTRGGI